MLDVLDGDRGQLGDLMAPGTPPRDLLHIGELAPTARAVARIVIDDLAHLILTQQSAPRATMTGLTARLTSLPILLEQLLRLRSSQRTTLLTRDRCVRGRRDRAIARARGALGLEHPHALLQPPLRRHQPHQKLHARITTGVINRLSLRPLHTPKVRRPPPRSSLWKPRQLNGYQNPSICRTFCDGANRDRTGDLLLAKQGRDMLEPVDTGV